MVKFKCKQSGNIVSFTDETDIASMRKEDHYEEIKDAVQSEQEIEAIKDAAPNAVQKVLIAKSVQRRGRPPKTQSSDLSI